MVKVRNKDREKGTTRMPFINYPVQHLVGGFREKLLSELEKNDRRRKKNKVHVYSDVTTLLA